jgi:tetratricopeptide (TPR) repeat protein
MAPEHLRAVLLRTPDGVRQVDHRADIYSLGMVLFEMLAGQSPFDQSASYSPIPVVLEAMALERGRTVPSLRQRRPDIPWSLESIVHMCLAPDPACRYQRAEHLADDLRCFLEDRPLRHAPELSRFDRARKWARRHPRLTWAGSVALVAILLLGTLGAILATTRQELETAQARERQQTFQNRADQALCLVNTETEVGHHLAQGQAACEQALNLYQVLRRDDWQDQADWRGLAEDDRQRLAEYVRELLLALAWARVQNNPGDDGTLRQALELLDRADVLRGLPPSRALWTARASYLAKLGEHDRAQAAQQTAGRLQQEDSRDHYLLATRYARWAASARAGSPGRSQYEAWAIAELDQALQRNPRHYWSLVQRGICYLEVGELALAASDFGTCVGLQPDFAWSHFNRGRALDQGRKKAEAIAAYTAALERDPEFLPAYVNRAMARLELRQVAAALADFDQALARGRDDAFLHAGRGQALELLHRPQEADEAFRKAASRAQGASDVVRTRLGWVYGFAVAHRLPDKARAAFDDILRRHPKHPQALYGVAILLVEQGLSEEALPLFTRAAEADPAFVDARRGRAVLLARKGQLARAKEDINWCLEKDPSEGVTLYAAACVAARAAEKTSDPGALDQALAFLRKAFDHGYGQDRAAADPDLAAIRQLPAFRRLLAGRGTAN